MDGAEIKGTIGRYRITSRRLANKDVIYLHPVIWYTPLCAYILAHMIYYRFENNRLKFPKRSILFKLKVILHSIVNGTKSFMINKKLKKASVLF